MFYVSFINNSTVTCYCECKNFWKKGNSFVCNVEVEFIPIHNFSNAAEDLLRLEKKEMFVPDSAVCMLISKVLSGYRIHNLFVRKCIREEVATGDSRYLYEYPVAKPEINSNVLSTIYG